MEEETKEQRNSANISMNSLPLFSMKRQRGNYWKFIKLIAPEHDERRSWNSNEAIGAWCELCKVRLKYSTGNINSVKSHLRTKHKDCVDQLEGKGPSTKKAKVDVKITDVFSTMANAKMEAASKGDCKRAEALLLQWISTSLRPFLLVEDAGFVELWHFLNQLKKKVDPPKRAKLQGQILKVSEAVMDNVTVQMESDAEYFSMTTDIWSSRTMESYMALTIHYLTADFLMKEFTLEVTPLRGSHTADFIREFWAESFARFGLSKDKLSMMLRDNASNGVKACNDWGIKHFGCIAHCIHLVVGPFVLEERGNHLNAAELDEVANNEEQSGDDVADFENPTSYEDAEQLKDVRKLVSKVRTIFKYVKNSGKAKEKLRGYCRDTETLAVVLDVRTRWNSALDMIQKFLTMKNPLEQFLAFLLTSQGKREFSSKSLPNITEADWAVLTGVAKLLKPFKEVTTVLSGSSYPTFALALPLLRIVKETLSDEKILTSALTEYTQEDFYVIVRNQLLACQRILYDNFVERFTGLDSSIMWISLLDPRMRAMRHLNARERELSKELVVEETLKLALIQQRKANNAVMNIISSSSEEEEESMTSRLFGRNQRNCSTVAVADVAPSQCDSQRELLKGQIQLELGNYLSERIVVSNKQDPLEWWRCNRSTYPKFALTARKWLSVCATSTASERVFSSCGVALTAKRSTLNGSTLKAQILLKNNLRCSGMHVDDIASKL